MLARMFLLTGCLYSGPQPVEGETPGECEDREDNDDDGL